jgi:hypothetical protein
LYAVNKEKFDGPNCMKYQETKRKSKSRKMIRDYYKNPEKNVYTCKFKDVETDAELSIVRSTLIMKNDTSKQKEVWVPVMYNEVFDDSWVKTSFEECVTNAASDII